MFKWPLVWRSTLDAQAWKADNAIQDYNRVVDEWNETLDVERQRYDKLLEAFLALRVSGANAPEPEKAAPAPKRPPAIVYRAMRAISPRDDATFAANWRLWEENQEECEKDPAAFAERIRRGRIVGEPPRAD